MTRLLLLASIAIVAWSQNLPPNLENVVKQGEAVFARTCANGYCHGTRGTAAGAPRLAARGFDQAYIGATVARGVPGTPMPAFATTLSRADLVSVIAYLSTLNGIANPPIAGPGGGGPGAFTQTLNAEAARGRDLFSEAPRAFGRCSTCHEVNGIGLPVAAPIANVPAGAAALKSLATPNVTSATVEGETMPVLILARKSQSVTFYDLTTAPPVLRTVQPGAIRTTDATTWKHSTVLGTYSEAELSAILTYVRASTR